MVVMLMTSHQIQVSAPRQMHLGLRLWRYTSFEYCDKNDIGDNVENGDGEDDIDSKDDFDHDDDQGWCRLVTNRDGGLVTSAPPPGCCNIAHPTLLQNQRKSEKYQLWDVDGSSCYTTGTQNNTVPPEARSTFGEKSLQKQPFLFVPLLCPGLVLQKILRRAQPPPPPPDGAMAAGGVWATGGGEDEEARHRRHCTHTQSFACTYTAHAAQSSSYAHTLGEFLYGEHWGWGRGKLKRLHTITTAATFTRMPQLRSGHCTINVYINI